MGATEQISGNVIRTQSGEAGCREQRGRGLDVHSQRQISSVPETIAASNPLSIYHSPKGQARALSERLFALLWTVYVVVVLC